MKSINLISRLHEEWNAQKNSWARVRVSPDKRTELMRLTFPNGTFGFYIAVAGRPESEWGYIGNELNAATEKFQQMTESLDRTTLFKVRLVSRNYTMLVPNIKAASRQGAEREARRIHPTLRGEAIEEVFVHEVEQESLPRVKSGQMIPPVDGKHSKKGKFFLQGKAQQKKVGLAMKGAKVTK